MNTMYMLVMHAAHVNHMTTEERREKREEKREERREEKREETVSCNNIIVLPGLRIY